MAYRNYTHQQIEEMLNNTRSIAKDTYMLLTAYILNSIKEIAEEDDKPMWGQKIPATLCSKVIKNCIEDFHEAGLHGTTIDVNGKPFTIRKPNSLHPKKIWDIINFPKEGDEVVISEEGVWNVKSEFVEDYDQRVAIWEDRRDYHRKVILMAGSDEGWNQLTDIEMAMYCWALWIRDFNASVFINWDDVHDKWWTKYYEYFELPLNDIVNCMDDLVAEKDTNFNVRAPFDINKIRAWNEDHHQKSHVNEISDIKIDTWWYGAGWKKFPVK